MARKNKYDEYVKPYLKQVEEWKKVGATDEQICEQLNIGRSTFYNYLNKHQELKDAYKKGRTALVMDLKGELARLAFKHTLETKKQYIRSVDKETKIQYTEITTKEVDGDIAAINLLLKNLDKENWANDPQHLELRKQELELRKAIAEANNFDLEIKEQ